MASLKSGQSLLKNDDLCETPAQHTLQTVISGTLFSVVFDTHVATIRPIQHGFRHTCVSVAGVRGHHDRPGEGGKQMQERCKSHQTFVFVVRVDRFLDKISHENLKGARKIKSCTPTFSITPEGRQK